MTGAEPVGEPGYIEAAIEAARRANKEIKTPLHEWPGATAAASAVRAAVPVLRAGWLAELGSDENVERVAREMAQQTGIGWHWQDFTNRARAVLGALTEAGT